MHKTILNTEYTKQKTNIQNKKINIQNKNINKKVY